MLLDMYLDAIRVPFRFSFIYQALLYNDKAWICRYRCAWRGCSISWEIWTYALHASLLQLLAVKITSCNWLFILLLSEVMTSGLDHMTSNCPR